MNKALNNLAHRMHTGLHNNLVGATFMMVMLKQKSKNKLLKITKSAPVLIIVFVVAVSALVVPQVSADQFSNQINALRAENANNLATLDKLEEQATSYQDAINKLRAAIAALQSQIDANTAEQNRLLTEIAAAEAELAHQKLVLGENIKSIYLEGQISTLEMLASSKDLSEFVDKQQYRNIVQNKIKTTLVTITDLKAKLSAQKEQVESLLSQQQAQQSNLVLSRNQQNNLLAYNESQQQSYTNKTRDNQSKIDALIAAQRRSNFNPDGGYYFLRFPGGFHAINPDAYPYKFAGFGMSPGPGCVDNDGPDAWGYCTRQCVSFAAWAVVASGREAPMYYGNARDWVAAAYARGIPISRNAEPGDVAISTAGFWGHAMYVESVSGNTFYTSEYNTELTGQLHHKTRNF